MLSFIARYVHARTRIRTESIHDPHRCHIYVCMYVCMYVYFYIHDPHRCLTPFTIRRFATSTSRFMNCTSNKTPEIKIMKFTSRKIWPVMEFDQSWSLTSHEIWPVMKFDQSWSLTSHEICLLCLSNRHVTVETELLELDLTVATGMWCLDLTVATGMWWLDLTVATGMWWLDLTVATGMWWLEYLLCLFRLLQITFIENSHVHSSKHNVICKLQFVSYKLHNVICKLHGYPLSDQGVTGDPPHVLCWLSTFPMEISVWLLIPIERAKLSMLET